MKRVLVWAAGCAACGLLGFSPCAADSTNTVALGDGGLTLKDMLQKVLDHNESLQVKMLDAEISRRQYKGEKGIFEPAVVGSYDRVDNKRENTEEERRTLFGATSTPGRTVFNERNNVYNGGLEFLSPVGSKLRLGYNLRDLNNNLNALTGGNEYVTTVGLTMTQPLLKNFGFTATLYKMRLAAITSDLAYQDYRRQMMLIVSRAEAAYWDLYLTQEQERISNESVATAQKLYNDNKSRLDVGKSSELEVLQAEAGLSLRRARKNDAAQKMAEAANQVSTLFSVTSGGVPSSVRAIQQPVMIDAPTDYFESYKSAFIHNPDYLSRRKQAVAENMRLAYTKNQLLPQFDFKGSYGFNGLGNTPGASYENVEHGRYPSWSVGVEFRIPITGGVRERNELAASRLSQKKSLVALREIETQIGNALDTTLLKSKNLRESVRNYESVLGFHKQLLDSQLARLEVGKADSKTVLETEEKLFEAKIALLDNLIQYQKALLELELVQGSTLQNRGLEISKAELQNKTELLLAGRRFSGPLYDSLRKEINNEYEDKLRNLDGDEKPSHWWKSGPSK